MRYADLTRELTAEHGLSVGIVQSHDKYDPATDSFTEVAVATYGLDGLLHRTGSERMYAPHVIRDLTMPKEDAQPVHVAASGRTFVNPPALNKLLRRKDLVYNQMPELQPGTIITSAAEVSSVVDRAPWSRLVVKPAMGMLSAGVITGTKAELRTALADSPYDSDKALLVQEFLDTSGGIPELDVVGLHNIRVIMVGGVAVLNCIRQSGNRADILHDDDYGKFGVELPDSMQQLIEQGMQALERAVPDANDSVIAIDLMRGIDANGEQRDVICEINRRPLRISRYDLLDTVIDQAGLARAALAWDVAEARLLASKVA